MIQSGYLSVLEAKTKDALLSELVRFSKQLGFETISAMAVIDHVLGESAFVTVDNAPAGFLDTADERSLGKFDPVMQHCKRTSVPLIWDQGTYVRANQGEKWELQARFGYRCGIAVALHLPHGRHFAFGVDRDQALPKDTEEITRIAAAVQLFAVHAQEAAMPLLAPAADEPGIPLTPRELETLRWTLEGKTAWEVGRILGIAENTVIRHAHSATQKLGCANKYHAAVKALKLRFIS
jgi:DNA-binding CsgD family transcriptional regulator